MNSLLNTAQLSETFLQECSFEQLLSLKRQLSQVNNEATRRLTRMLVEHLRAYGDLTAEQAQTALERDIQKLEDKAPDGYRRILVLLNMGDAREAATAFSSDKVEILLLPQKKIQ